MSVTWRMRRRRRQNKTTRKQLVGGSKKAFKTNDELHTATYRYFTRPDLRQSIIHEYGEIINWDTHAITNMDGIFNDIGLIETDKSLLEFYAAPHIIRWDTSNVVSMKSMFSHCRVNIIVEFTNCKKVKSMENMFSGSNINCPILFETSNKLTNLSGFLSSSRKYNNILEFTDLTGVTTMENMFSYSRKFNQPVVFNNLPKLKTTRAMFFLASNFNSRVIMDTSNVKDMSLMFREAELFDNGGYPLEFNTRSVTTMEEMFSGASAFNNGGHLLEFDTRKVTDMEKMFSGASAFNNGGHPLKFNTYNVENAVGMFSNATNFNQKFIIVVRHDGVNTQGCIYNSGIVLLPTNEIAILKAQLANSRKNKREIKAQIKELEMRNKQYVNENIKNKYIKLTNVELSEAEYSELFDIYYPSFNEKSAEEIKALFEIEANRHSVNKLSYMFNQIGQPLEIDNISMLAEMDGDVNADY
jgi:hypothetical protein